jgi:arginyl-tRNA synthetase
MDKFKQEIVTILKKITKQNEINLETPPSSELGDYAFPCFSLAKIYKKNPNEIAQELIKKIKLTKIIKKIEIKGAYLNFFIDKEKLSETILKTIYKEKNNFGKNKEKDKIIIEFPSPNTNKPLHLGHIRNILIGQSISNLLRFLGNKVYQVNLNNDRGIHICKSMWAYQKFGNNKNPDKKPDHFVGDFYVLYEKNKSIETEKEIQQMLTRWEQGDEKTRALWRKLTNWVLKGFNETYRKFNLKFDKTYNESEIYDKGKTIVLEAFKKRIFYKDNKGMIIADLEKYDLGKKVLLRADGTSIYITQDIYLAKKKYDDFKINKSIYVVASEQNYHFKVLFKILELLKYKFAKNCYHLSYGMIYLPEGKMKSREGTIVDADDIIEKMQLLAEEEIIKRHKELKKDEIRKRANMIGLGALRYYILKYDTLKDIHFNPKESISFEGETGPYIQYAHARICSIERKYSKRIRDNINYSLLKQKEEFELIKHLAKFPEIIKNAAHQYKPYLLANYLYELAKQFNEYYHKYPVLKVEQEIKKARLLLINCIKQVLKTGLNLLGINAPESM